MRLAEEAAKLQPSSKHSAGLASLPPAPRPIDQQIAALGDFSSSLLPPSRHTSNEDEKRDGGLQHLGAPPPPCIPPSPRPGGSMGSSRSPPAPLSHDNPEGGGELYLCPERQRWAAARSGLSPTFTSSCHVTPVSLPSTTEPGDSLVPSAITCSVPPSTSTLTHN
ncbi:unnamed protein product [Pleuronectes platessa]|uniref:Uncharacterized protein n=1 Tax=Pleuronectes platessa TaxID=8262 RepID=A0A9N7VJH8_PLEPL|nr:unnamed protein product [Pleuronectes platessa]